MQYDIEHRFMVGGAFKVGPLLLGIHNWANIFSKQKMQDGGGYLRPDYQESFRFNRENR